MENNKTRGTGALRTEKGDYGETELWRDRAEDL